MDERTHEPTRSRDPDRAARRSARTRARRSASMRKYWDTPAGRARRVGLSAAIGEANRIAAELSADD